MRFPSLVAELLAVDGGRGKKSHFSLWLWPPVGFLGSRGWLHTHVYMIALTVCNRRREHDELGSQMCWRRVSWEMERGKGGCL